MKRVFVLAICLFYAFSSHAAELTSHVDRNTIGAGDSVELTVEFSGQVSDKPDFSPLLKDFEIASQGQSSSVNIVNGNMSATTSWTLMLFPKREGKLVIASLQFHGESSAPITIMVTKGTPAKSSDDIMLRSYVDKDHAYVDEQIIYRVELLSSKVLQSGSLTDVKVPNALVEPVGTQKRSRVQKAGIMYDRIEVVYAIYPQKAGMLHIDEITFMGAVSDGRGGFDLFGRMGRTKQVRKRTQAHVIAVKDKPASYPEDAVWLPARDVTLSETWSTEPPHFEVGVGLTRTIKIRAQGGLASFLRKPKPFETPLAKVYEEKVDSKNEETPEGRDAVLTAAQVVVPTTPGKMVIPAERIYWWDTGKDELRESVIPERSVTIAQSAQTSIPPAKGRPKETRPKEQPTSIWFYVAIASVTLCLFAAGLYLLRRHRQLVRPKFTKAVLLKTIEHGSASQMRDALISFGKSWFNDESIHTLSQLRALSPADLALAIEGLERAMYSRHATASLSKEALKHAIENLKRPQGLKTTKKSPLAEIVPKNEDGGR